MKFLANSNWTKSVYYNKKILYPQNLSSLKKIIHFNQIGICGNLRSFNDTCINKNKLVSLKKFSKKIFLDKKKSLLYVSSNYLLIDVLKKIVPLGYMISISPGSKYVTIGGMISNNVIGKNSENNQFRYILKELEILCANKKVLTCSNKKNKKLFDLTIGGFGLTGIILGAVIKLKKIRNQKIEQEIFKFHNFKEFENIVNKKTKFNVSWIDSHYLNKKKFRGLFYYGDYSKKKDLLREYEHNNSKVNFLTNLFLKIYINNFYFSKFINLLFFKFKKKKEEVSFDEFFYPQDKWLNFNECYSNGFFQIQFLIPEKKFKDIINEICDFFQNHNLKSTFIILKKINEKGKYLNFYGKGYSISFDFENNSQTKNVKNFFSKLIYKNQLRTNFSKDLIQKYEFIKDKIEYNKFKKEIINLDKKKIINSEFSKRLKLKSIDEI
tara:strand:+ start:7024 stop:8337 length:1314 start_codon:yes stop_codon:yes gene_type:complete